MYEARNNSLVGDTQKMFSDREGSYNKYNNIKINFPKTLCSYHYEEHVYISICGANVWSGLDLELKRCQNSGDLMLTVCLQRACYSVRVRAKAEAIQGAVAKKEDKILIIVHTRLKKHLSGLKGLHIHQIKSNQFKSNQELPLGSGQGTVKINGLVKSNFFLTPPH